MFPEPRSLFEQFAATDIPQAGRRKLFLTLLDAFGILRKCEQSLEAMRKLADSGANPFERDTVSRNFRGLYPELSFSAMIEDGDTDPYVRAAKLIAAVLAYRDEKAGRDKAGNVELRHGNLFGRVVELYKSGGGWRKRMYDSPVSEHIAVAVRGRFYRVPVYSGGTAARPEDIAATLRGIAAEPGESGYGALTATAVWHAIPDIDSALFVAALDIDATPEEMNDLGRQIQISGYRNRDYRKSFQLVVCGNGKAGGVFNLFSGLEGVTGAQFMSWIARHAAELPDFDEGTILPFSRIETPGHSVAEGNAAAAVEKAICLVPTIHRIDTMSKNRIKALGVSPDAFFHAAIQMAYRRRFGRVAEAHNFIDLRMLRFGSISRYPSTTPQMRRFTETGSRDDLLAAFAAHKRAIDQVRSGDYPLHYIYYYLFAAVSPHAVAALLLLKAFIPRFTSRYLSPDLWLSNIPALPGLLCMCRFGVVLRFLRSEAFTGHYLLFPDHVKICFTSCAADGVRGWDVKADLERSFVELERLLKSSI